MVEVGEDNRAGEEGSVKGKRPPSPSDAPSSRARVSRDWTTSSVVDSSVCRASDEVAVGRTVAACCFTVSVWLVAVSGVVVEGDFVESCESAFLEVGFEGGG